MGYQSIWPAYETKLWPRAKAKLGGEATQDAIKAEVGKPQNCDWSIRSR
jgi:hypothetical protein